MSTYIELDKQTVIQEFEVETSFNMKRTEKEKFSQGFRKYPRMKTTF